MPANSFLTTVTALLWVWLLILYQCVTSGRERGSQVKQYNVNINHFPELKMNVELTENFFLLCFKRPCEAVLNNDLWTTSEQRSHKTTSN